MSREVFYNLLKRYLEGKCTEEEQKIVEQWYGMLDDEDLPDIKEAELAEIDEKLWAFVSRELHAREAAAKRKKATVRRMWPVLAAAASFAGLAVMVAYLMNTGDSRPDFLTVHDRTGVFSETNNTAAPLDIWLDDSSHVTLQPGARLTYPVHFAGNVREVGIRGEAFFDVTKDPARPFYVYSQDLVTRVVGTSFIVRAHDNTDRSEVAVLTGKVVVTHQQDQKNFYQKLFPDETMEVVLTPNYKAVYRGQSKRLEVSLVDDPRPVQGEDGPDIAVDFVFNNTSLADVLAGIEKTYGITVGADKGIYKCTFTGDLTGQDLYTRMDFICQSIGATYTVERTGLYVKGGTCK